MLSHAFFCHLSLTVKTTWWNGRAQVWWKTSTSFIICAPSSRWVPSLVHMCPCVCVCVLACGRPLFIQPCYEACGSLFAEPVFVKLSQKRAWLAVCIYQGSHLYLMEAQGQRGQRAPTGSTLLVLEGIAHRKWICGHNHRCSWSNLWRKVCP